MYEELIDILRIGSCEALTCIGCDRDGICQTQINRMAADAIEELSAYVQQNDDLRAGYHDKAAARVAEGGNMLTIESYTDGIKPCTCNNCKHGPRMPNKVCNTCTIYKPGYGCWLPYANWEPKEET